MTVRPRSPRLALILALCFPGLGQLYNREWLKGAIALVAGLGLIWYAMYPVVALFSATYDAMLAGETPPPATLPAGPFVALQILVVWSAYDAFERARKFNRSLALEDPALQREKSQTR